MLSSHILLDVERTCERVAILHEGQVVEQGSIAELKGKHSHSYTVRIIGDRKAFETELANKNCDVMPNGQHLMDVALPAGKGTEIILKAAVKTDVQLRQMTASIRSLEDVFVKLITTVN